MDRLGDLIHSDPQWDGPPEETLEVTWPFGNLRKTEVAVVIGNCVKEINELLCLVALENHRAGLSVCSGNFHPYGARAMEGRFNAFKVFYGSRPAAELDASTLGSLLRKGFEFVETTGQLRIWAHLEDLVPHSDKDIPQLLRLVKDRCLRTGDVAIVTIPEGLKPPDFITSVVHVERIAKGAIRCTSSADFAGDEVTESYVHNMNCAYHYGHMQHMLTTTPPAATGLNLESDIEAELWRFLAQRISAQPPHIAHRTQLWHCVCEEACVLQEGNSLRFVAKCQVQFVFREHHSRPAQRINTSGTVSGTLVDGHPLFDDVSHLLPEL